MECSDYKDLAAAHADGTLSPGEASPAELHVRSCDSCHTLRRHQVAVVELVRTRIPRAAADPTLRQAIVDKTTKKAGVGAIRRHLIAPRAVAGAIAAAMLFAFNATLPTANSELIAALAADVEAAHAATLRLDIRTDDPNRLRSHYAHNQLPFSDTVADLAGVGFTLVGGGMSMVGNTPTTRTLYTGPGDTRVVCRRFRENDIEWPEGGVLVGDNEIFTRHGVQISLKRIGNDIVCAMASKMPSDQFMVAMQIAGR